MKTNIAYTAIFFFVVSLWYHRSQSKLAVDQRKIAQVFTVARDKRDL